MSVDIRLRQPGIQHVPPQMALWLGGNMKRRIDLQGCPWQVTDYFTMNDFGSTRHLDGVMLFDGDRLYVPTIPNVIRYGFPYARSAKGQIRWKRAFVKVRQDEC